MPALTMACARPLSKHHHVGERTGHREAAIIHCVVEHHGVGLAGTTNHVQHACAFIAGDDEVTDLGKALKGLRQHGDAFGRIARA